MMRHKRHTALLFLYLLCLGIVLSGIVLADDQNNQTGAYPGTPVTTSSPTPVPETAPAPTIESHAESWQKTFGGSGNDYANSVQQTSDGGYIIAGYTDSSGTGNYYAWLIKTDASGNKLWDKTFGGSNADYASSVQQTSDGGYIAGYTDSSGNYDAWLIKTDASGNKLWDKTFGGSNADYANSVQQTSDGGYIIAGKTDSYGAAGNADARLIKTDANGN